MNAEDSGLSAAPGITAVRQTQVSPRLPWRGLEDLTPRYAPDQHARYLRALVEGIEGGVSTNIALSGPYGAGKSSILDGLVQRYPKEIIQISLATIRSHEAPASSAPTANELQKEIVKQLLYAVDPARTPASRFPRTSSFRWWRGLRIALITGAGGVAVQWIIALIAAVATNSTSSLTWQPALYIPTFLAVSLLAFLLLRFTNGRITVSDLTAGPAKLTLTSKDGSYFDDYLDEIVYFFEATRKRIVILEDMDRFNNVEVFEDLRALNILLNHAAQLSSERLFKRSTKNRTEPPEPVQPADLELIAPSTFEGPIVFVYAIRDSLLGKEVQPSSTVHHDAFARTKFFDLIVPVVPFLTEQSARGALRKELKALASETDLEMSAQHQPTDSLIRTIAQYFPDQRQIRNIRNEFAIYREQLLQPGRHPSELTADRLLGLILYKNLQIADFELIRLGESQLHYLLRLGRALTTENLETITTRLSHPSDAALRARAKAVGEQLLERATALGIRPAQRVNSRYDSWAPLSAEDLQDLDLWRRVVAGDPLHLMGGQALAREHLEQGFNLSLTFAEPTAIPLAEDERSRLEQDRQELEHATWASLWRSPQYVLSDTSDEWTDADRPEHPLSFAQIARKVLGEGLASDLIANDVLTANFALLSAHFDGEFLSLEAQNFVTLVTESSVRQHLTSVSDEAITQIIDDRTAVMLERSGMVNIHVLGYLLRTGSAETRRLLAQLRSWTDDDQIFLRDFLSRFGESVPVEALREATGFLASLAPQVLSFLATNSAVPNERRALLVDAALSHIPVGDLPDSVATDEAVRAYVQDNHAQLPSLRTNGAAATAAANCLLRLGTVLGDVRPISGSARAVLVPHGLFDMSVSNLSALVGDAEVRWVSLERLRRHPDAYASTLKRVDEYLNFEIAELPADEATHTAETPEGLILVLTDLTENGSEIEYLTTVAERTDAGLCVSDLSGLDASVQEALLRAERALATTANLMTRLTSGQRVTPGIAATIHAHPNPQISDGSDLSPLASSVLAGTTEYAADLTADVVSEFVNHLHEQVTLEEGSILAAETAVAVRLIDDGWGDLELLRIMATDDLPWPIRETLLGAKPAPDIDVLERLVSPSDVGALLASLRISDEVRANVPELLDVLLDGPERHANATSIGDYLDRKNIVVELDTIHQLIEAGADSASMIRLVLKEPARTSFSAAPGPTLRLLGGSYAAVIDRDAPSPTFEPTPEMERFVGLLIDAGVATLRAPGADGRLQIRRIFATG